MHKVSVQNFTVTGQRVKLNTTPYLPQLQWWLHMPSCTLWWPAAFACIHVEAYGTPLQTEENRIPVSSFNLYTKWKQWSSASARLVSAVSLAALKRYQDDNRMLFKNNFHDSYLIFSGKTNTNQPHTHIFLLKIIMFIYYLRTYIIKLYYYCHGKYVMQPRMISKYSNTHKLIFILLIIKNYQSHQLL